MKESVGLVVPIDWQTNLDIIKSISYDQAEIIKNTLLLHSTSGHIDVDPTYSKGIFYKNTGIDEPTYKFDINPICEDVKYADSRHIPLEDSSVEVEMFDPPFLATNGILIFKCQDKISSGKQYMSHCFIMNEAVKIGFYPKDLFILIAKQRLVADWQAVNQKNARKYHSYFWVFQKSNRAVQYL